MSQLSILTAIRRLYRRFGVPPNQEQIGLEAGITSRTVRNYLDDLASSGEITLTERSATLPRHWRVLAAPLGLALRAVTAHQGGGPDQAEARGALSDALGVDLDVLEMALFAGVSDGLAAIGAGAKPETVGRRIELYPDADRLALEALDLHLLSTEEPGARAPAVLRAVAAAAAATLATPGAPRDAVMLRAVVAAAGATCADSGSTEKSS